LQIIEFEGKQGEAAEITIDIMAASSRNMTTAIRYFNDIG
jgi:hypothetical protein